MKFDPTELVLRKVEICLLEQSGSAPLCSCCQTSAANFQTRVWYDGDDANKDNPITEMLCRACLSRELTQEWGINAQTA